MTIFSRTYAKIQNLIYMFESVIQYICVLSEHGTGISGVREPENVTFDTIILIWYEHVKTVFKLVSHDVHSSLPSLRETVNAISCICIYANVSIL